MQLLHFSQSPAACRAQDSSKPRHLRSSKTFTPFQSTPQRHAANTKRRSQASRFTVSLAAQGTELEGGVVLPTKMNCAPHPRELRRFFYKDASNAVLAAVKGGEKRMKLRITIPELNREMDVYRIGTLLEWVREVTTALALDGRRTKVCVQQSMGQGIFQGLPLNLSGVRRIMDQMDWGDAEDFKSFGQVGADQIDDSDYYVLIAPQNVVGNTIMTNLEEMVVEAEQQGKTTILINPVLVDVPSAGGVMGVRGRKERMALEASFPSAYHFRLLYLSNAMVYPIMGAMRYSYGQQWEVYKRVDLPQRLEQYQLIGTYPTEPDSGELTRLWSYRPKKVDPNKPWWA